MCDLNCKKPTPCRQEHQPVTICAEPTPPFEQCVGDYVLIWDGKRLSRKRVKNTPDGTYSSISIIDGCPVAYDYQQVPVYTPPYCSPNPTSCQSTQSGSDTIGYSISPNRDNSLVQSVSGLFARTFIKTSDNSVISITGTGTSKNPYFINFTGQTSNIQVVGESGITHRDSNGITYIGLSPSGVNKGMYNGFYVNEYGQITGVSDSLARDESSIKSGAGLTVTDDGQTTTIAHSEYEIDTEVVFGGFAAVLNKSGHIIGLERIATVMAGTYSIGAYNISINEYGGITNVSQNDNVPDSSGTFTTRDNKVISYDETGRITDVTDYGNNTNSAAPQPIRDMHRFTVQSSSVKKESYGGNISISNVTNTSFDIQLPDYVSSILQVQVNGALSHNLNGNILTITHTGGVIDTSDKIITVVLRA